jgi:uncharacterized protein (TIGR02145 family)
MKRSSVLLFFGLIVLAGIMHSCTKEKTVSGTFKDTRDNKRYNWVKIGDQVWMAENLSYLPSVSPSSERSSTAPYYYVYGYKDTIEKNAKSTDNYSTYGVLYNWPAAMVSCPTGWHLPTDKEWKELFDYLGGSSVAGGKLKAKGSILWPHPNTGATNESNFLALPGGYLLSNGAFYMIRYYGYWWSATEYGATKARSHYLFYLGRGVGTFDFDKKGGVSVRCVKD